MSTPEPQPFALTPGLNPWDVTRTLYERIDAWQRLVGRSVVTGWLLLAATWAVTGTAQTDGSSVSIFGLRLTPDNPVILAIPVLMILLVISAVLAWSVRTSLVEVAKRHLKDVAPDLHEMLRREFTQPPGIGTVIYEFGQTIEISAGSATSWARQAIHWLVMVTSGLLLLIAVVSPPAVAAYHVYGPYGAILIFFVTLFGVLISVSIGIRYTSAADSLMEFSLYPEARRRGWWRRRDKGFKPWQIRAIKSASTDQLNQWVLERSAELGIPVPIEATSGDDYTAVTYHPDNTVFYYVNGRDGEDSARVEGHPTRLIRQGPWSGQLLSNWTDDERRDWLRRYEYGASGTAYDTDRERVTRESVES